MQPTPATIINACALTYCTTDDAAATRWQSITDTVTAEELYRAWTYATTRRNWEYAYTERAEVTADALRRWILDDLWTAYANKAQE